MKQNSEYRAEARKALEGKWGDGALLVLVYYVVKVVICGAFGCALLVSAGEKTVRCGSLLGEIIMLPISFALMVLFLRLFRNINVGVKDLFSFYNGRVFLTMLLQNVYLVLWSFLCIIPGIIKFYSYSMTEFVMLDDPDIQNNAAIEKSMALMKGHKMKLFLLDLSFIGWAILAILTCGLGLFLLIPYMNTTRAAFYEDLKAEQ